MRVIQSAACGVLLAVVLSLAGCGSSDSAGSIPTITFKSAAMSGAEIPVRYTCDGSDTTPPLEWGEVPAGTGTLVLFVVGVIPTTKSYALSVEWAVAGIDPALHMVEAGRLPAGAYVGEASNGKRRYSICPEKGETRQYQFELYALPAADSVARDWAGGPVLLKLARKGTPAIAHGDFITAYRRV